VELPLSTEHILSAELGRSETLLWSGRPRQGVIFRSYDPFVFLFALAWTGARQRAKTHYGLTNERVIIISGVFSRTVKSLQLRTLSDVSLTQTRGEYGTITFGPTGPWMNHLAGSWSGNSCQSPAFESITHSRDVFDQIRHAQKAA
jgi:hypothetical protein